MYLIHGRPVAGCSEHALRRSEVSLSIAGPKRTAATMSRDIGIRQIESRRPRPEGCGRVVVDYEPFWGDPQRMTISMNFLRLRKANSNRRSTIRVTRKIAGDT
jgi:hypothetical protein